MSVTKAQRKAMVRKVKVKREKKDETKALPLSGLCVTCAHVVRCGFRVRHTQPVIWCEEFEAVNVPLVPEETPEVNDAPSVKQMEEWDKYKGLCVNCENRETCQIRNSEIGIWHCEEYR